MSFVYVFDFSGAGWWSVFLLFLLFCFFGFCFFCGWGFPPTTQSRNQPHFVGRVGVGFGDALRKFRFFGGPVLFVWGVVCGVGGVGGNAGGFRNHCQSHAVDPFDALWIRLPQLCAFMYPQRGYTVKQPFGEGPLREEIGAHRLRVGLSRE